MKRFIVVLLAAVLTLGTVTAFGSPTPAPTPVPVPVPVPVNPVNPAQPSAPARSQSQSQSQAPASAVVKMDVITLEKVEAYVDDLLAKSKLPGGTAQATAMKTAYAALADPNENISVSDFVTLLTSVVSGADDINLDDYDFTSKNMNHVELTASSKNAAGNYTVSFGKTDLPSQLNANTANDMCLLIYDYTSGKSGVVRVIQLSASMLSASNPTTLSVNVPCSEFDFTFIAKK